MKKEFSAILLAVTLTVPAAYAQENERADGSLFSGTTNDSTFSMASKGTNKVAAVQHSSSASASKHKSSDVRPDWQNPRLKAIDQQFFREQHQNQVNYGHMAAARQVEERQHQITYKKTVRARQKAVFEQEHKYKSDLRRNVRDYHQARARGRVEERHLRRMQGL